MNKKIIIIAIAVFLLLPATSFAENQVPSFPMAFWGDVRSGRNPLPIGAKVGAFCDSTLVGEVELFEQGIYGYKDTIKSKLLIAECLQEILFKYKLEGSSWERGYSDLIYSEGFEEGKTVEKNLYFVGRGSTSPPVPVPDPTPTPPSSSSGGGGRDRDVPDDETEDKSEEEPEGEVLGEIDARDYKEQEEEKEEELKVLKSDKSRLNRMRALIDSLLQIIEEENKKEHEEALLIIIERLEEIEEKVDQEIEETEEKLEEIRRKMDLLEQKERAGKMERMIDVLLQSIEGEENKEEAKSALKTILEKIEEMKSRIEEKMRE